MYFYTQLILIDNQIINKQFKLYFLLYKLIIKIFHLCTDIILNNSCFKIEFKKPSMDIN